MVNLISFQFIYRDRVNSVIENHVSSLGTENPLFVYLALQNVHNPLEVPLEYESMYDNIEDEDRRKLSGMVTVMDDALASIVSTIQVRFFFKTVNGGQCINEDVKSLIGLKPELECQHW